MVSPLSLSFTSLIRDLLGLNLSLAQIQAKYCEFIIQIIGMSSKNLKVYKMKFITELRKLTMNVKFACKIKATWKRSSESAESTWVPLQGGIANFDQTLQLKVNMYFDTTTDKFVEKKCLYSFFISTDKGQKSAGSFTIDLAEFFNKRTYELDQAFTLDKCPVAGTKIQMKIHYEEDATQQAGYDSMSCISATNPMDSSMASVDLGDLAPTKSNMSEKEQETQKSSDLSSSKVQQEVKQENYVNLDASDVMEYSVKGQESDGTKIGENIKSINNLTAKINQFVTDKSKNIKYEIQGFKRKINSLEEQVQAEKIAREKVQSQLADEKKKNSELHKEYMDFKVNIQHQLETQRKRSEEIQGKYNSTHALLNQMELKMSESGQSQSTYIQQLKNNMQASQVKFTQQLEQLRENLVQQKRIKNQLNSQVISLEGSLKQRNEKYNSLVQKYELMQEDLRRKEEEIEATRINLEKTFEKLVSSLNAVI